MTLKNLLTFYFSDLPSLIKLGSSSSRLIKNNSFDNVFPNLEYIQMNIIHHSYSISEMVLS